MKAQKYVIDDPEEDNVDVETVSENGSSTPVLQAGDLNSLLEQFEASEEFRSTMHSDVKTEMVKLETTDSLDIKTEKTEEIEMESKFIRATEHIDQGMNGVCDLLLLCLFI